MALDIPSISSTGFKAGYQILLALAIIVGLAILGYFSNKAFSYYRKLRSFKITALIINRDGTFYTKKIGKFKTADNIDKMCFIGSKDTMPVINTADIRNNKVVLWRYGINQYAVIPPRVWEAMDPKRFKIEVIDYQMKNFAYQEQRAAISRWAFVKDALTKWAPFITMFILIIATGVIAWFLMKLGYNIYNDAVSQRIADCKIALGTSIAPPG